MKSVVMVLVNVLLMALGHEVLAFYNPQTGRWLSRDPIEEKGGLNNYIFTDNRAPMEIDVLGLILPRPVYPTREQSLAHQEPLPPSVNAVTVVDYFLRVNDVTITVNPAGSCCCKLKAGSFTMKIKTTYATMAPATTAHEGAHAGADYLLGNTMLPFAINCMKTRCADIAGNITKAECLSHLRGEAERVNSMLEGLADGLLQDMHHLYIGTVGYSTAGEDAFQAWLEAWLPAWQDDIRRTGDCKFW